MRKALIRIGLAAILFFLLCAPLTSFAQESEQLFSFEKVKKSGTLWKMFGSRWKTVAKINRISPERIKEGMTLKVPYDWEAAEKYTPMPRELPGLEGKFILIDLVEQAFGAYENGTLVLWGPISSSAGRVECGKQDKKKRKCVTPTGNFKILEKKKDDFSNDYPPPHGGAPMPYSQRFYGPYKIHEGALPGYPDSHGCIRVLHYDAVWLFKWTNKKTVIIIT
ncbi:MAG: L,D-transpeptidase family protein [Candidatus Azambacteria bacterium]|nr:L,D-transpeptidase family protein [Candidatus Azambacteria bacterium]